VQGVPKRKGEKHKRLSHVAYKKKGGITRKRPGEIKKITHGSGVHWGRNGGSYKIGLRKNGKTVLGDTPAFYGPEKKESVEVVIKGGTVPGSGVQKKEIG